MHILLYYYNYNSYTCECSRRFAGTFNVLKFTKYKIKSEQTDRRQNFTTVAILSVDMLKPTIG